MQFGLCPMGLRPVDRRSGRQPLSNRAEAAAWRIRTTPHRARSCASDQKSRSSTQFASSTVVFVIRDRADPIGRRAAMENLSTRLYDHSGDNRQYQEDHESMAEESPERRAALVGYARHRDQADEKGDEHRPRQHDDDEAQGQAGDIHGAAIRAEAGNERSMSFVQRKLT